MTQPDRNACIFVISDGKPGHLNQSLGLAEALCHLKNGLEFKILSVYEAWSTLLKPEVKPRLIISTGRKTHLINALLSRVSGTKNVVLMRPSLPKHWFDACMIPAHDEPKPADNIVTTVGAINRMRPAPKVLGSALILIGGPSKHFDWSDERVANQIEQVVSMHPNLEFQIATSRRTPATLISSLKRQYAERIVTPANADQDWLKDTLTRTEYAWVSSDSASMLYEALTAGAKVSLIELPAVGGSRVAKGVLQLKNRGLVNSENSTVQPLNEAMRCAKLILEKGWL